MTSSLCFITCDYLYPEMKAAVESEGFSDVGVRAFPARCGRPPIQWEEITEIIHGSDADHIEVFGCYCLQKLKDPPSPDLSRCKIHLTEQCFHMLCGKTLVNSLEQEGAYVLTPGWLSKWKQHIADWGFDRTTATEFFGQSLRKLLLLDTYTEKYPEKNLKEFSEFLNIPYEILPIGLDFHRRYLEKIIADHRHQELKQENDKLLHNSANSAMAMDLLGRVTQASTEVEVIQGIIELFTMLLAPENILYVRVNQTGIQLDHAVQLSPRDQQQLEEFYKDQQKQYQVNEQADSFLLRVGRGDCLSAIVNIQRIAFPQYIDHYLNVAIHISGVCALAIEHARTMEKLINTSRLAGKAEVATEVLHNVGNTLNSISVSSEQIRELIEKSSGLTLPGIVDLINQHTDNVEEFFGHDPRGKQLPLYFTKLSEQLTREQKDLLNESNRQIKHIRLVSEIIRTQQDAAKKSGLLEQIDLSRIIEECLQVFAQQIKENQISIERNYLPLPAMKGERHKILQVLNNLISNAIDAFDALKQERKTVLLRLYPFEEKSVVLEINDNGKGMSSEVLEQIFVFGFSTKKNGHGFGLHSAANLANEMNGTLSVESSREGYGSIFRLQLPIIP
jgi:signal transduction histidine kinase